MQSQLLGMFGFNFGKDIENDQPQKYNPKWSESMEIDYKSSLPNKLNLKELKTDHRNLMFDSGHCKFEEDQKKFDDYFNEKYGSTFKPLYDKFENGDYKFKDWFKSGSWDISTSNSICDWIFTRLYYFKDFILDPDIKRMCISVMAINNYIRYLPKGVHRASTYLINQKISEKLKEVQEGSNKEQMMLMSGHDDNVSSFIMNFYLENYQCIIDNFKLSAEECFEKIKFSTNIMIEVRKEDQGDLKVVIYYNGKDFSYSSKKEFTISEFIEILQNDNNHDYQAYCVKKTAQSKWIYYSLAISSVFVVALIICLLKENSRKKERELDEQLIDQTNNETL